MIDSGYRESTKDNIKSQYEQYKMFCNYHFLNTFPADSWQLVWFSQYLANQGKKPSTISNAISTVRTLQALKGHSVPDLYDICIKLQLKGLNNLSNTIERTESRSHDTTDFAQYPPICRHSS